MELGGFKMSVDFELVPCLLTGLSLANFITLLLLTLSRYKNRSMGNLIIQAENEVEKFKEENDLLNKGKQYAEDQLAVVEDTVELAVLNLPDKTERGGGRRKARTLRERMLINDIPKTSKFINSIRKSHDKHHGLTERQWWALGTTMNPKRVSKGK